MEINNRKERIKATEMGNMKTERCGELVTREAASVRKTVRS